MLLTIPIVIVMHFWLMKHSKMKAMKFANFNTLKRITGKKLITKNWMLLISRVIILFCVIMGVTGSVLWYDGESNSNDFVIAIDTSASMSTQDLEPSRLEVAKRHAISFMDVLKTDAHIGLITFSGITFVNQPMTKSTFEIKEKIKEIELMEAGGTDLPGAIITATNLMTNGEKGKTLILLSDGSSTVGAFLDESIKQAIEYAQNKHVIINTIGTGTDTEQPIGYLPETYNITSVYNEETLARISDLTNGKYYQGANNQQIIDAFNEIAQDSKRAKIDFDMTFILMLIAMVLLFIEWGMVNTRFKKLP